MTRRPISLLFILMAALLLFGGSPVLADTSVFINELHYDNDSTDSGEAIEIAGPTGTDLSGWSLVLYNGTGGAVYTTTPLSGVIPNQQNGFGTVFVSYPVNGIQNGSPDGVALVDAGNSVVQFLSYEGSFTAVGGAADGLLSTDIGVSEASTTPVGQSLRLTGSGAVYEDFTWAAAAPHTFGAVNTDQTFGGPPPPPEFNLSEIRTDQTGTDVDEYFELTGTAGAALDGLTFLVIGDGTGGSGVIEEVTNLTGQTMPGSGFFVAAESTFTLGTADLTTDLNFENSDNVTHLLVRDFSGSDGNDLDTDDDGVLDTTPWTEVVHCVALLAAIGSGDRVYCDTAVGPDAGLAPGHTFVCEVGWQIGTFAGGQDTPGEANPCGGGGGIGNCGDPATFIHDIQGSGLLSPLAGTTVVIEGVVVGDFQNNGQTDSGELNGFYVQEEDSQADANGATSEGIFVFAPDAADVLVGDLVRLGGTVTEFATSGGSSLTELGNVGEMLVCAPSTALPAVTAVTLPVTAVSDFERYEGMFVQFPQELTISEYFNFDRFNETVLTLGRQHQPTAVVEPGAEATALAQAQLLSRVTLDDGRSSQNPDPAIHPNGNVFDLTNLFRGGDTVQNVTGVVDDTFGLYRIQPTQGAVYSQQNPRPASPEAVGGTVRVSSFNVLNYFSTIDTGAAICGPAANQECRGADTSEEFVRQRTKIIAALVEINADVVGLIELENHPADAALQDLVAGLNDALGAGTYAYISTGPIGTDAIKVAIIYKSATVTPVGDYAILDSSVDPRFLDTKNRPVLAQTFMASDGGLFTFAINHLKSKGSDCNDVGDPDIGDGQGNCNLTRTAAAQALVDWLATDPTGSGDADFLIMGDLNSYDKEDPIDAILVGADDSQGTADDYTDLVLAFQGELAYGYVFDGKLGYLDHALGNASLTPQVTGVTEWHINADEPDLLDYDMTFKQAAQDALYEPNAFRSSDHDAVLVGLDLTTAPICGSAVPSLATLWPPNHRFRAIDIVGVTDPDGDAVTLTIDHIFQDEPVPGPGNKSNVDGMGIGTATAQLRAERAGNGNGRVYHVYFTANDSQGNSCSGEVLVGVPHNQGGQAVDDGPLYDSTGTP